MIYEQSEPFQNPGGAPARRLFSCNDRSSPCGKPAQAGPKLWDGLGSFENGNEEADLTE